jgi:sec-independent protein translocase protein TatA
MAGHLQTIAFIQNIGGPEWMVILVIALLIFGRRLPEVARSLGKSVNEFKKGMREFQDSADEVASDLNKATNEAVSEADAHATQTTDEPALQTDGNQVAGEPAVQATDDSSREKPASGEVTPTDTFPEPMS